MSDMPYRECVACEHPKDAHAGVEAWDRYFAAGGLVALVEEPPEQECRECGCGWYEDPDQMARLIEETRRSKR